MRLRFALHQGIWKFEMAHELASLLTKDTIETMKWTNELFHQFRKYKQISQKLENFLQINIFFVFSENCWTFREILGFFFAKFIKILLKNDKILKISRKFSKKCQKKSRSFLLKIWDLSGAKEYKSCRSRKMLKNAPTLAIVAVHTDENEPLKILRWFVH